MRYTGRTQEHLVSLDLASLGLGPGQPLDLFFKSSSGTLGILDGQREAHFTRRGEINLTTSTTSRIPSQRTANCCDLRTEWCPAQGSPTGGLALLRQASDAMRLSARGYHRVLRVARTLTDLGGADVVRRVHLAEAPAYRALTDEARRAA